MKKIAKKEYKNRDVWRRTGQTDKRLSHNGGGMIISEKEVNQKGWTRWVDVGYQTIVKKGGQ